MAVEFLSGIHHFSRARGALAAMRDAVMADGDEVKETTHYEGKSEWLVMWGVGAPPHAAARNNHRRKGGKVLLLDIGYSDREECWRFSLNDDHPHRLLDMTPNDREPIHELKDVHDPAGTVIIAGMGAKSKRYLRIANWETNKLRALKKEFPSRKIIVKEKKDKTPFEDFLVGASLVVGRHSNCCVDAAAHNIPFRCEDGAAYWLKDLRDREVFLRKLAYWQCNAEGSQQAWKFIKWVASQ